MSRKKAPKSTKLKTAKKRSKKRLFAYLGVSMVLVGIVGLSILAFLVIGSKKSSDGKIKVENVNPEVAEELNKQLVYTTSEEGVTDYYSPEMDLLFKYKKNKYYVTEGYGYISISPRKTSIISTYAKLDVFEKKVDVFNHFKDYYSNIHDDVEEVSKEDGKYVIKHTQKSYIEEKEDKQIYHTIIKLEKEEKTVVIEIKEEGGTEMSENMIDDMNKILESVELNPEDIAQEVAYEVKEGGVSVNFDKSKWVVVTQSDSILGLTFRSRAYESEDLKSTLTTFNLTSWTISEGQHSEEYMKGLVEDNVKFAKQNYKDKSFEMVEEMGEKEIGGEKFLYTRYTYLSFGDAVEKTVYIGFNPNTTSTIQIITINPTVQSEGGKANSQLLERISFTSSDGSLLSGPGQNHRAPVYEAQVTQDQSRNSKKVLGTSTLEIDKAVIKGKPAVVHIFNKTCVTLKFGYDRTLPNTASKSYDLCLASTGSGSFVNKDGYILTNAHVATPNPKDVVFQATIISMNAELNGKATPGYDPDELVLNLMKDLMSYYKENYPNITTNTTKEYLSDDVPEIIVKAVFTEELGDLVTVSDISYDNYVQKDKPFDVDFLALELVGKDDFMAAEIEVHNELDSLIQMEIDKYMQKEAGFKVADLALLKVEKSEHDYPSLLLEESDKVTTGDDVVVIGFPGSAENEALFSNQATVIPTVTDGNISAIKPNFDNSFDLIQIDASVSGGNSGGPIINQNGNIVGVLTYRINAEKVEAADFNAGIAIEEVEKLMTKAGISNEVGEVNVKVDEGLDYFEKEYYKWAKESFTEAKDMNSSLEELLNPLIKIAEEKIEQGEDKTPFVSIGSINLSKTDLLLLVCAGSSVVLGSLIIMLALIIKLFSRKKKTSKASPPSDQSNAGFQYFKQDSSHGTGNQGVNLSGNKDVQQNLQADNAQPQRQNSENKYQKPIVDLASGEGSRTQSLATDEQPNQTSQNTNNNEKNPSGLHTPIK